MKGTILKATIIILVATVIVEGWYIFDLKNKQTERQEFLLSKKAECQEVGAKQHAKYEAEVFDTDTLLAPQYSYNADLKTCLYRSGLISGVDTDILIQMWVMDTYSGKEILSGISYRDGADSYASFKREADELMGL